MTKIERDPLNPWAAKVAPAPVEQPEPAPGGPPVLPPPELPPAPGPRQTWADEPVTLPLPLERPPGDPEDA